MSIINNEIADNIIQKLDNSNNSLESIMNKMLILE
jgi:hypothetical protein